MAGKSNKKKGNYRIHEVIRAAEVYAVVRGADAWVWVSREGKIGWCDDYHITTAGVRAGLYPNKDRQLFWHSRVPLDRANKRVSRWGNVKARKKKTSEL